MLQLTELDNHFSKIDRHVVAVQLGLIPDADQESSLFRVVICSGVCWIASLLCCSISLYSLDLAENFALDVGHYDFKKEVDNLCRDGEVYNLFLQSVGINLESSLWCCHLLFVLREWLHGQLEDVEVRHNYLCKWYVN